MSTVDTASNTCCANFSRYCSPSSPTLLAVSGTVLGGVSFFSHFYIKQAIINHYSQSTLGYLSAPWVLENLDRVVAPFAGAIGTVTTLATIITINLIAVKCFKEPPPPILPGSPNPIAAIVAGSKAVIPNVTPKTPEIIKTSAPTVLPTQEPLPLSQPFKLSSISFPTPKKTDEKTPSFSPIASETREEKKQLGRTKVSQILADDDFKGGFISKVFSGIRNILNCDEWVIKKETNKLTNLAIEDQKRKIEIERRRARVNSLMEKKQKGLIEEA